MATPIWQAGKLYLPGAIVRPVSSASVLDEDIANPGFESGDTGWTKGTGWVIEETAPVFEGTWRARFNAAAGVNSSLVSDSEIQTAPGEVCSFECYIRSTGGDNDVFAQAHIFFYTAADAFISSVAGTFFRSDKPANAWKKLITSGTAPANAAYFKVLVDAVREAGAPDIDLLVDGFVLTSAYQPATEGLIFTAVQPDAGFSGGSEPTWPTVSGNQVVDNEVTWEAFFGTRIVWQANRILVSGSSEPTWPDEGSVADGSISWELDTRQITDEAAPNSKVVALAASKIFAADADIVPFCATVNPLDWSSTDDAGFLPFGLQTYGSQDAAAMALYRSNLVIWNSKGYQMWQVDEDPANMALLDAAPVGTTHHLVPQPVMNDLLFLSSEGIRSIGIAGASTNLQAGDFGKQIDPLVKAALKSSYVVGSPADVDAAVVTVGGASNNWGYQAAPLTPKGSIAPSPFNVNGAQVVQIQSSMTSNAWQIAIAGNRAQDFFYSVTIEDDNGDSETFLSADADSFSYSGGSDVTFWQFGTFTEWTSASNGVDRDVSFTVTPAVPGEPPLGLYVPNLGQFWCVFGDEAFVLTINGTGSKSMSWSRYTFPTNIDDWTIMDGDLYLRSGDLVWKVDSNALSDDEDQGEGQGGTDADIVGYVAWPYLDMQNLGKSKMLESFDLVVDGEVDVQFGYDQTNEALVTDSYVVSGDTLPGTPIPMPITAPSMQMRLTFTAGQEWEWTATVLYLSDNAGQP